MKTIMMILFTFLLANVYAQDKQLDRNAQLAKLESTQLEIIQLEDKITKIEERVNLTPPSEQHPSTQEELDKLKSNLLKLKRVEFSIKAYLEESKGVDKKNVEKN